MNKKILCAALVAAFAIAGCTTGRGGGWLPSKGDPSKKATFGFQAKCKDGVFKGQIQYVDMTVNPPVVIHGSFTETTFGCMTDTEGGFEFDYIAPKLPGQPTGDGDFFWRDGGQPGPSAGDYLEIDLSGPYNYEHSGTLGGGNIQAGN